MRLTKQTNYAIRLLMYCAANKNKLSQISEIARVYRVSELFLFKIIKPLVKHNILKTIRGRNGGVMLNKEPQDITVAEIVRVTEESFALAECFGNDPVDCPLTESCGLNATFSKALNAFFAVLESTTLLDLQRDNFKQKLGIKDK